MRHNSKFGVSLVAVSLAACFGLGVVFHKYAGQALRYYLAVSGVDLIKSPGAVLRVNGRGWDAFDTLQYTRDYGGVYFRRYIETGLLPLVIDGKRLSDSYPVPKIGGAITSVGSSVIILDRLGGLYRYNLTTDSFAPLQIPRLPNNLEAYVHHRPDSRYDLADANSKDEFRAYDVVFLSDRKELAVSYDKYDATLDKLNTAVSVIPIDIATLDPIGDWEQVFISDPYAPTTSWSGGGRMAYHGDGKLYLTVGDHEVLTDPNVSQDPSTTLGKIIEIDISAKRSRNFASGVRNPQGLTFTKSGELLSTEHGERGGDELNLITEGSNYGWPNVTLGTEYDSYNWRQIGAYPVGKSLPGSHTGYTAPLFAWVPSIAASQLIEVNNFDQRWNGDLLLGSLKASSLYRLRLEAGRVLYSEPIFIGQRIRDIMEMTNGTIILWTDDTQLLFLTVDKDQLALNRRYPAVVSDAMVDSHCLVCHHFGSTSSGDFAPTLSNLLNRPIASDAFRYSPGLRAKQGTWTKDLLFEFLSDPTKFANGTNMPAFNLDPEQIKNIVDVLVRASPSIPPGAH
jgi:glucose/arabinose dehydrogenase/cytochrome c2